jgi:uncharacterized protein
MRIATQPELPIVGADIVPGRSNVFDGHAKKSSSKSSKATLWLLPAAGVLSLVVLIAACPATPNAIAGLSVRHWVSVGAIVFLSGVMSGLSGFGFSAVGAASLLILPPILQVPLFQALSTGNQLLSVEQLRKEMPRTLKDLWAGPGPCMVGGTVGAPIGIWLLANLPAARLMMVFGVLLSVYATYSLFKPSNLKLPGLGTPPIGMAVGFLGGVIGGFTAFPGAAVVVWTGLRGLSKERHRAIVQPYIILSQVYSLILVAVLHPTYLTHQFWVLLGLTAPAAIPGTLAGVAIYRNLSDVNFKRISYILLGLCGISLLAKICGSFIQSLF